MDIQERIAQWEKMTQEVPDDMAWFSLGTAYQDAGRLDDAAAAFDKAIEMNSGMSRAYQLSGQILIQLDQKQRAIQRLTEGYTIAADRGDVMPQRAMGSLLEKLGQPLPQVKSQQQAETAAVGENQIMDRRTGQPGARLGDPPMRGSLGQYIYHHFSQETWHEWIGQGTKVINELRLDFSNDEHQKIYDMNMMEWLGISQEEVDAYAAEGKKAG